MFSRIAYPYTVPTSIIDPTLLHPQSETACSDGDFRDIRYSLEQSAV